MKEFHWLWCEACNEACIRCEFCGNISCAGGGCEKCDKLFDEAIILSRDVPYKEGMEIVGKFPF